MTRPWKTEIDDNNNNNERISRALFLVKHAQLQLQKYETHGYKTPKTACVLTIMLKRPTKQ